jgi:prevent-host-death family protein
MRVTVTDAKNKLAQLIRAVEGGETVTICRRGIPVVDLVPASATSLGQRQFGTLKGRIEIYDPDWWKPMTDEETKAFLEGRFGT